MKNFYYRKKLWLFSLLIAALVLFMLPSTGSGQNEVDYLALGENLVGTHALPQLYPDFILSALKLKDSQGMMDYTRQKVSMLNFAEAIANPRQQSIPNAKIITLMVGYEDLFQYVNTNQTDSETFKERYTNQLEKLLQVLTKDRKAKVIMGDFYNPFPLNSPKWGSTERLINSLNQQTYQIAWRYQVAVAPVKETIADGAKKKKQTLLNTDFYPNEAGQQAIAHAFFRVIKEYKLQ